MTAFQNFLIFFGRIFFSVIFLLSGIDKIIQYNVLLSSASMANHAFSEFWLIVMIVLQLGAGILVLLGWKTRFGALLALISICFVQFMFHSYWLINLNAGAMTQNFFLLNLALFGAGLTIMAAGPGQISVDGFRAS